MALAVNTCFVFAAAAAAGGGGNDVNLRPVVGFLVEEFNYPDQYPNASFYLSSNYVKAVEAAGARAAPVFLGRGRDYYREVFQKMNGLVIQGGNNVFQTPAFVRAAEILWEFAMAAPPEKRKDYPIWGICLGIQLMAIFSARDRFPDPLDGFREGGAISQCDGDNTRGFLNVSSADEWRASLLGSTMPDRIFQSLSSPAARLVFSSHHDCLLPDDFYRLEMDRFWRPLATDQERTGALFLTLVEAREYPIWASQFHPEKPAFEWLPSMDQIPRGREAVHVNAFFMEFFVDQARKSANKFSSREEEEAALIFNYSPTYLARTGPEVTAELPMEMVYLFTDEENERG